jgi:hypothetical protein
MRYKQALNSPILNSTFRYPFHPKQFCRIMFLQMAAISEYILNNGETLKEGILQ